MCEGVEMEPKKISSVNKVILEITVTDSTWQRLLGHLVLLSPESQRRS